MVQKRCRSGFNTGNTLRSCDVGYRRNIFKTPVLRYRFRRKDIEDKMDDLWRHLSTHSGDLLAQYQCLALLGLACDAHDCLQVADGAVSYSLDKKGRWEVIERLRSIIEGLSISWKETGLRVRFVDENGTWKKRISVSCSGCDEMPEEDGSRKGKVRNMHFRGIQRKTNFTEGWKRGEEKKERHLETKPVAIEYFVSQNGCFADDLSRSPLSTEDRRQSHEETTSNTDDVSFLDFRWCLASERRSTKNVYSVKKKRRDVLEYPECQELKGVAASKYLDHIYGYDLNYETKSNTSRRKIGWNDELTDRFALENADAAGDALMTTLFITETEVKSTRKKLESKMRKNKPQKERLSLWQFIEENLLSRYTDRSVTFMNCKNRDNCSSRKLSFSGSAAEHSSLGIVKDPIRRCDEEKEESPADSKRSRKRPKKQKSTKSNGIHFDYQSLEIYPVFMKLKSSSVEPQKIRSKYGSEYRESTISWPRTFWINLSKVILTDKVTTSKTDQVFDYLADFSLLLLFHEISTSHSIQSSSSIDDSEGKKSFILFTLHLKVHEVDSDELSTIAKQIQEAFVLNDRIFSISEVVGRIEEIFRMTLHYRRQVSLPPHPPTFATSPPSQIPLSSQWDWVYEMQNWDMKIYKQHEAISALLKENRSSLRRPLSATGYPISRPNSIARKKRNLGLLQQDSNLNVSTPPCSACGSQFSICPPSTSLPPPFRSFFIPVSIPSDHMPPPLSVQTPPVTMSGRNWISVSPCGHSFCSRCWTRIASDTLDKRLALDKCPASDGSLQCQSDIDPVDLLLSLPLRCFWRHLFNLSTIQLSRHPQWKWCPNDRCLRAVKLSASCLFRRSIVVRCECGGKWCFQCLKEGHWPASCSDAKLFRDYLHQEGIDLVPTVFSASRSLCLLCDENSADYGISQPTASFTELPNTLSKDNLTNNLSNGRFSGLPAELIVQPSNGLSNRLSNRFTTKSLNGLKCSLSKELKTSDVSQSWSNHFKLPHIGATYRGENRLDTVQTSCKSDQTQRSLLKQEVVLKNNVSFEVYSDVTTQDTCSCTDEICIKCLHLDGHAFQLPVKFSVERQQSLVSLRCSSVVPLLLYRSAINHRSMKMLWNTAAAEARAKELARKLMKNRQLLHRSRPIMPGTKDLGIIRRDLSVETGKAFRPPLERLNSFQKSSLAMPPRKKAVPPGSRLDSIMEVDMFLLISVQQFAHQVHSILENVYIMSCFDPFSEKTSAVLRDVIEMEKILSTLEMVTKKSADKVTDLSMPQLVKVYDRGQEILRLISKQCGDF